jgi:hypothetical protein
MRQGLRFATARVAIPTMRIMRRTFSSSPAHHAKNRIFDP